MGIVVLSLFDGISGGMVALERAGIAVDKYFASEVDKYAEMISKFNYSQIIRLGDVRNIETSKLPKIDLLIGGFPCQSFSMAGKRNGMVTKCEIEVSSLQQYLKLKEQGFEFEGQSYLFWEFIRIKEAIQPEYFFLENVRMTANWSSVITQAIGIQPIMINSALLSAQNRERLYWTNIGSAEDGLFGEKSCKIPQPKDRGILLKDIIEHEVDEKYYLSEKMLKGFEAHKQRHKDKGSGFGFKPKTEDDKANTLRANLFKSCPTDNYLEEKRCLFNIFDNGKNPDAGRVYSMNGKSITLKSEGGDGGAKTGLYLEEDMLTNYRIRRLTPIECERLQTLPDNYTRLGISEKGEEILISDTQRYKAIGNGWTIGVIVHIFSYLPINYKTN